MNGIKDSLKEKRQKIRFEGLKVVVAMGDIGRWNSGEGKEAKKYGQENREREANKDDETAQIIRDIGKTGDPQQGKRVDVVESVNRESSMYRGKEMEYESEKSIHEKEICSMSVGVVGEEGKQESTEKTIESRTEKGIKMVRHNGKLKYIEDIKDFQELDKSKEKKEEIARFNSSLRGAPILEAELIPRSRTNNKDANTLKITPKYS